MMLFLWATVTLASISSSTVTPVQKVVQLLNGMKEKGKQEKHDEQKQFATYKQFCEDTSAHKQQAIKDNNRRIDSLRAAIAKHDADAKRLTGEVNAHEADISVFEGDKKAAAQVRAIEHSDFTALDADYSESIDALERAITVLKKEHYDRKQAATLLQQLKLSAESRRVIDAFLARDPEDDAHLAVEGPQANAYEFQSQGIVDLLAKLKNKFDDERESARKEEANSKHAFELLSQDLASQIEESTRQRNQKAETRAQRQQAKGGATGELTDTIATRDDDQKYLTDLTATCEQKASDFEERQQLRADEIAAIEKATEILSSGAVAGAAEKHLPQDVTSFLQLRSSTALNRPGGDQRQRVALFLKDQASRIHSRVLSTLAVRVAEDPFQKVKALIKDLIVRLMEEATQETEQKGWCDTELTNNEHARKTKTSHVELLHANVDEMQASTASLAEDIAALNEQVVALDQAVSQALDMRANEKERNGITVKDAQDAQSAIARAVAVLERFYAQAGEATALVQQQPESPAIFDSPYRGMLAESGGITGMLEVIQSDFARLEAETTAAEAQAQKEHQEFLNDSEVDKAQKSKDIEHKTASLQSQKQALAEAQADLVGTQKELDAALAYYDTLKPQCIDSGVSYEERTARRKEEIESLQEALRILAGEELA
eukprot:GEMP01017887.1.p1 GENE.GEMP01017887.1~~GEMP01017887.1.p1  ORF type:complete len:663 (-),score=234.80 GEMP01017887.1:584-2572(-)